MWVAWLVLGALTRAAAATDEDNVNVLPFGEEIYLDQLTAAKPATIYFSVNTVALKHVFVLTSCKFDPQWTLGAKFIPQYNMEVSSSSSIQAQLETLTTQKVLTITRDQAMAGMYKLDITVGFDHPELKVFAQIPSRTDTGYVRPSVGMKKKASQFLSWKTPSPEDAVTCLVIVRQSDYDACDSCGYIRAPVSSNKTQKYVVGSCAKPLYTRCEPGLIGLARYPKELRYVDDTAVAMIMVVHPETSRVTPYDHQVWDLADSNYSETPEPQLLTYITMTAFYPGIRLPGDRVK
jgi:hypothetical protein